MKRIGIIGVLLLAAGLRAFSQGFVNLNFEGAKVTLPSGTQPGPVLVTNALFGWSVYFQTFPQTQIYYDDISIGSSQITLVSASDPYGPNAIGGSFSVFLQAGAGGPVTVSQTGLVPSFAKSMDVDLAYSGNLVPVVAAMNGQTIPLISIATFPAYTEYAGDISAFDNQEVLLSFTQMPPSDGPTSQVEIDNIQFSSSPIPEPSTLAIGVIGALLLGLARWRK